MRELNIYAMQTGNIEHHRYRELSVLPLILSLCVSRLSHPRSPNSTTTIYIVTGGAVLYSPLTYPGRILDGEISRANIRTRNILAQGTRRFHCRRHRRRSRIRSGCRPSESAYGRRGYPRKIYTRATSQFYSGASGPGIGPTRVTRLGVGTSEGWAWSYQFVRGRLFAYEDGGGGGRRQALMPMHHAYSKLRRGTAVRGS